MPYLTPKFSFSFPTGNNGIHAYAESQALSRVCTRLIDLGLYLPGIICVWRRGRNDIETGPLIDLVSAEKKISLPIGAPPKQSPDELMILIIVLI